MFASFEAAINFFGTTSKDVAKSSHSNRTLRSPIITVTKLMYPIMLEKLCIKKIIIPERSFVESWFYGTKVTVEVGTSVTVNTYFC